MLQGREHVRATMARSEVDAALHPTRAKLLQQLREHERFVASNRLAIPPAERCRKPEPLAVFEEGELIGSGGQGAVRHGTFWPKGAAGTGYASAIKCGVARADAMAQDPLLFFAESSIAAAQGESEFVAPMQGCDVRPLIVSARCGRYSRDARGRETWDAVGEERWVLWSDVESACAWPGAVEAASGPEAKTLWHVTGVSSWAVYHLMQPYPCAPLVPLLTCHACTARPSSARHRTGASGACGAP